MGTEMNYTVLVLSICDSINSWNYFLRGMGTIISRKKLPFVDITHILYSVDSHARRGCVTSRMQL